MSKNQSKPLYYFTDLDVWKKGHELVLLTYKLTERFPKSDTFGLSSQMQRAAISITSNIAEGFGRQAKNDKKHFYIIARASLTELQNQLIIARDTGKITEEEYEKARGLTVETQKLLHGLIRSTNNRAGG